MNGFGFGFSAALGALLNPSTDFTPILLEAAVYSDTRIDLTWVNMSDDYDLEIEQSTDNVFFTKIADVTKAETSYSVTGLTAFTQYYFRAKYKNGLYYCRVAEQRTRPLGTKYPFVETSDWNNSNMAIKDIRLYVPDSSIQYMVYKCGTESGKLQLTITEILNGVVGTEVVSYTWDVAKYIDSDAFVKFEFTKKTTTSQNLRGYILVNFALIRSFDNTVMPSIQYHWQMTNKPQIRQECIVEIDPIQVEGNRLMVTHSHVMTPANTMYAHESSLYSDDDILIMAYLHNIVSGNEDNVNQYNSLLIVDKTDFTQSTELIIAKGGETHGGVAFDDTKVISVPRIYKLGNGTIRIYFWYNFKTYYRDYDKTTQALGNVFEFKAIISGGTDPVSLTNANLRAHCEAVSGTSNAIFNSMNFLFRDTEAFVDIGDGKLYCACELIDSNPGTFTTCFPIFMESSDGGETWTLKGIAYLPTLIARKLETNIIYYSGIFYLTMRIGDYKIGTTFSTDNGATWDVVKYIDTDSGMAFMQGNMGLRHAITQYKNAHLLFYSHQPLAYYNPTANYYRTSQALSFITKMGNNRTRLIANYLPTCHYQSLCYDKLNLYLAYTTGDLTGGGQNSMKNTIRLTKIPLREI